MKIYSDRILNMIMQKGYTINAFASEFGFTQQSLSAWLKGEYNPKPASVRRLANALKCEITDIAEYTGNLEQVFDEIDSERFWGADIYDNLTELDRLLNQRKSLNKNDFNYYNDLQEVNFNIKSERNKIFQAISESLGIHNPEDHFLQAVIDYWDQLNIGQRAEVAGIVASKAENNRQEGLC